MTVPLGAHRAENAEARDLGEKTQLLLSGLRTSKDSSVGRCILLCVAFAGLLATACDQDGVLILKLPQPHD